MISSRPIHHGLQEWVKRWDMSKGKPLRMAWPTRPFLRIPRIPATGSFSINSSQGTRFLGTERSYPLRRRIEQLQPATDTLWRHSGTEQIWTASDERSFRPDGCDPVVRPALPEDWGACRFQRGLVKLVPNPATSSHGRMRRYAERTLEKAALLLQAASSSSNLLIPRCFCGDVCWYRNHPFSCISLGDVCRPCMSSCLCAPSVSI